MKFEQYGIEKKNLKITTEPQEFIEHNFLKDLHNLLGQIKKEKQETLNEFIEKFSSKLRTQMKRDPIISDVTRFSELIKPYTNLVEHQTLTLLGLCFFLEKFGISEKQFWENKKDDFPAQRFHQTAVSFYLNQLKTLIDILGEESAISFYKDSLLNFIHTYDTNQINIHESLEKLRESHIRFISRGTLGRIRLFSNVEDGKLIVICKNCEKIEYLDEETRKEKDLLYTTGCWVHIPLAEMWNENFVLTLEECIAKGDPFCSYVYHDKRIVDKIVHPPREFFEEIIKKQSD